MGSLFSALTTAVAGLGAQSSAIGNISDNLSNAQTTGYKAVSTDFQELVNASNASVNNPGGVKATPAYQNDVQGSITSADTATYMAISGQGYFAVESASTDATGATIFNSTINYTRQGDFTLNKDGYLVNGSGYYLMGYNVSSGIANTASTTPIQISSLLNDPVPTANISYVANLPSNAATTYTSSSSTVQIYDSLGNTHDVNYVWNKTATNTWDLNITIPDAAYTQTVAFTFNDGTGSAAAGTLKSIASYSGTASTAPYTVPSGTADIDLTADFTGLGAGKQNLVLNFGALNGSTGVTQFSDTNGTASVTNFSQDGLPKGSFSSLAISKAGLVSINYSNGTNLTIAQIPIVQFYAQDQLQRVSGGAYASTIDSGTPRYSTAGLNGAGTISSNSLEQSNVDIASEFTQLIQAQQVYSANAKVVTTDNTLLQTTINMVQ
ncbi:MAG: flagellar hook-basal body complex protein [Alphaproteobacteria bacterium]|nr:flagellar hook-basal body complex protein [Alphaproteobacteria bacterium]